MTRSAASPRALLLLLILTLAWGTNWPLFPIAMREISVWTFRAITLGAGGVILLAMAACMTALWLALPSPAKKS